MLVGFEKVWFTTITFPFLWISLDLMLFAAGQTGLEIHNKGNFECHDNRTAQNYCDFADSTLLYNTI